MGKSTKTKFLSDSDNELYSFHTAINNNQTNKLNFKNFNEIDKKLNLFEINKKGYLSLILKYLIITKNNIWLKLILNKYLNYLRINDCLLLIKYLDNEVLEGYNAQLFFDMHLNKWHFSTKSIEFLINNNLNKYLILLNGYYTKLEIKLENIKYLKDHSILFNNLRNFNTNNFILNCFEKINKKDNSLKYISKINDFLNILDEKKNYIILDCGNILHSISNGIINNKSYKFLIKIINNLENKNFNPIIVIHCKHLDVNRFDDELILKEINYLNEKYKNIIFKTPYSENDDYFILILFFIIKCKILTKDNFGDHLHLFVNSEKNSSYQIKYILNDSIVNYNFDKNNISFTKNLNISYSTSIQYIDKKIYIPNYDDFIVIDN